MKKFFKWFFIVILSLGVIYLVAALFLPSAYKVERNKTMAASPSLVYEQVSNLDNWAKWSPWERRDSTMKKTYEGTPGAVGSIMHWDGDPESSGKGSIELTELVPNKKVVYKLTFKDWGMTSTGIFTIDSIDAENSKLTWSDEGEIGYIWRPICAMMMNHDEMMGPDFEKGLVSIDSLAQIRKAEIAAMFPTYDVQTLQLPAVQYIGIRYDTVISAVDSVLFGAAYGEIGAYLAANKLQMAGAPVCITYSWDQEAGRCELVPAIPVTPVPTTAKFKPDPRIEWITFEPKEAIAVDYYGDYMDIWKAHDFLGKYATKNNIRTSLSIEEYVTDPTTVSTYDSVLTKLYYHVEK
jgi:effector-binding domain-containing protein/uncharacterized protein YndB with AHSA1/START domain